MPAHFISGRFLAAGMLLASLQLTARTSKLTLVMMAMALLSFGLLPLLGVGNSVRLPHPIAIAIIGNVVVITSVIFHMPRGGRASA